MKKIPFSEIIKRITGFSTPIFGISWEPPEIERDKAKYILTVFEDSRVLFSDYRSLMVDSAYIPESLRYIRGKLTEVLATLDRSSELAQTISGIRSACRRCSDRLSEDKMSSFLSIIALGELRATIGIYVAQLCSKYGLDIEEGLASILPPNSNEE